MYTFEDADAPPGRGYNIHLLACNHKFTSPVTRGLGQVESDEVAESDDLSALG
jgi:hypothetical protein